MAYFESGSDSKVLSESNGQISLKNCFFYEGSANNLQQANVTNGISLNLASFEPGIEPHIKSAIQQKLVQAANDNNAKVDRRNSITIGTSKDHEYQVLEMVFENVTELCQFLMTVNKASYASNAEVGQTDAISIATH